MVKSIKYIIKRIIIGVGIALVLGYLRGNLLIGVKAMQVSSYNLGTSPTFVISNANTNVFHDVTGNPFAVHNGTSGYVNFNFSVYKVGGSSTAALVMPRGASVSFGNGNVSTNFVCNIGSVSSNNSTFNSQVYSAHCPVNANSNGLTQIYIAFQDFQANDSSTYRVIINSGISYEIMENTNINLDTSGTTNAINNQINNDNTNTQNIINNNNTNTQTITDNQDSNTQDIINNQNSNTDKEIESQRVCSVFDKLSISFNNNYLNPNNGNITSTPTARGVTDFISITSSSSLSNILSYTENDNYGMYLCFYNINKTFISCLGRNDFNNVSNISIPTNSSFVRFTINSSINAPQFKICTNGNQAITDATNDNTNAINGVNNTLNDDTPVSNSEITDLFGDIHNESSSTPVSDLLTMPITLLQAYIDGFNSTCSPVNLGNLYGTDLILPCISPERYLGASLWSLIDVLFSIYMVYNIAMLCISIYEGITSLNDSFNDLFGWEGGKHAAVSRMQRWEAE